jgi:hypothetical protein
MTTEPLSPKAIEAYMAAVDWFVGLLHREEVTAAWAEPSCLAQYTLGGVSAHAVHSVMWLEQVLRDTEPTGLRLVTVGEFFGPNRVGGENDDDPFSASLRAAAEKFAVVGAPVVVAACTVSRDGMVGLLQESTARRAIPVVRVAGGQVPLCDYLRTRVLEIVVHGDDVACSVPGMDVPDPPAASLEVCLGVCVELARARVGAMGVLRAFTRAERARPRRSGCSEGGPRQARTLRRKFLRPRVRKRTLKATMAG